MTIDNEITAKLLSEKLLYIYAELEETVEIILKTESADDVQAYKVALTGVLTAFIFDVLEPLYKRHPALAPQEWK